jgi:hypothetical protein
MIYLYIPGSGARLPFEKHMTEAMVFTDNLKSLLLKKSDVLFCLFEVCGEHIFYVNHMETPQADYYPDILFNHPFEEKMLETGNLESAFDLRNMDTHQFIIMAGGNDFSEEQVGEIIRYLLLVHAFLQDHYSEAETPSIDRLVNLRLTVTMKHSLNQALKYYHARGKDALKLLEEYRCLVPKTKEDVRRIYHELYDRLVA